MELLYWVFGSGWGGAWISKDGVINFPSTDWKGDDSALHLTNEPGYAIPLNKLDIRTLFSEANSSYERFENILQRELGPDAMTGPSGDTESIRAETILSGPSTQRLLGKMGLMNYLRPSVIDERGINANLVGAAVLAAKEINAI